MSLELKERGPATGPSPRASNVGSLRGDQTVCLPDDVEHDDLAERDLRRIRKALSSFSSRTQLDAMGLDLFPLLGWLAPISPSRFGHVVRKAPISSRLELAA
jgi:hypothetical protein